MPDTQWKAVAQSSDGRRIGWDGDPSHGWVPIPSTPTDKFAADVAKGAGFDPQKVFEASETPAGPGRTRLGNMADEILRESARGFGHWVLNTIKDPAHLIDPLNAMASNVAGKFDKSVLRPLLEAQKFGVGSVLPKPGELLGSLAGIEAGADTSKLGLKGAELGVARPAARMAYGVGKTAVDAAFDKFTAEAAEARKQYETDLAEARTKNAGNRAAAMDAARKAEQEYQAKVSTARQAYQDALGERIQASAKQSAIEAKKGVTGTVKSGPVFQRLASMADTVATNAAKTRDAARAFLDTQWAQLRKSVGAGAKTNFQPVLQAVIDARENMLQGSPESIKIFNNILREGGGKEFLDTEEGPAAIAARPTEIPYRDAQGYYTELGTKMFGGGEIPGDVWRALNHVREAVGDQMAETHRAAGPGVEQFANGLRKQWSQFMDDFYNPDSPLRKLINTDQSQGRIQQLAADNSNLIAQTLGRYQRFGGNASLAGRVRSLRSQIAGLPGTASEPPELPTEAVRKALASKPTEAKVSIAQEPAAPDVGVFDPRNWRLQELLRTREAWSRARPYDLSPWSITSGRTGIMRGGARLLNSPAFREWLAGPEPRRPVVRPEQPTPNVGGGTPPTAGPSTPQTPTAPPPATPGTGTPSVPPEIAAARAKLVATANEGIQKALATIKDPKLRAEMAAKYGQPIEQPAAPTTGAGSVPPWAIGPLLQSVREQAQRQAFSDLMKRLGDKGPI